MQYGEASLLRREFLGQVSMTVGGATLAALLPVSLLEAATPAACLVNAAAWPDPCGDWQLDDVFTAYPPYSLHPAAAVPAVHATSGNVADVDRHWVS
jgi:hypothetical protein